jgi:hypothetical protein
VIDDIRHGKDGKDGRSKDDDPDSRRCRVQPVPRPAEALAPAPQPSEEEQREIVEARLREPQRCRKLPEAELRIPVIVIGHSSRR